MEQEVLVNGIILSDSAVGDYDKRISLLTLERGRISAFLRGAKRPGKSPLSFLGPFCYGKFWLYEGRGSFTVKRTEIENRFEGITNDLENLAYGSYFLDVAGYYSRENADESERVKLIYVALKALEKDAFDAEFVRLIYELKNIAIMGEFPNVFECAACKGKEDLKYFSLRNRTILCEECRDKGDVSFSISPAVLKALIFIFTSTVNKLYTFKLSPQAQGELREFANKYMSTYFPHRFKTLDYIDILTI